MRPRPIRGFIALCSTSQIRSRLLIIGRLLKCLPRAKLSGCRHCSVCGSAWIDLPRNVQRVRERLSRSVHLTTFLVESDISPTTATQTDVSALGLDFQIRDHRFGWQTDSGTSASTPVFASVISLINDRLMEAGKSPLGFLNPFLYSAAGRAALNDITEGSNPGCNTTGFAAAAGWDPVRCL